MHSLTERILKNNKLHFIWAIIFISTLLHINPGIVAQPTQKLSWENLGKLKRVSKAPRSISKLNGKTVRITGFMVPLDGDSKGIREFLLVPFQGQCIHVPPPPPNQIIHVKMARGRVQYSWEPIQVTGTFVIQKTRNEFGGSFFKIKALRASTNY